VNYNISKQEAEKIINMKGDIRGTVFKTDGLFVLQNGGEEKLKEVEQELEEMGYPLKYKDVHATEFYPFGTRLLSVIAISKVFDLNREGVKKMGRAAPKSSFLVKFFTKHFLSTKQTLNKVGEVWEKHSTTGTAEAKKINEEEGCAIFIIKEVDFHPVYCAYMEGYLEGIISMTISKKVTVKETKCPFYGGEFHEFKANWEN